jgi:hypothetical protein
MSRGIDTLSKPTYDYKARSGKLAGKRFSQSQLIQ